MRKKSKFIPKSKRVKYLGVYCHKCKTMVVDFCGKTGCHLSKCPHSEHHVYKANIYVPESNQRKTRNFETDDHNEAKILTFEFEREIKEGVYNHVKKNETRTETKKSGREQNKEIPTLLIHIIAKYISFLYGENIPESMHRKRSKNHLKDIERAMKHLISCLKKNGYNIEGFAINDFSMQVVRDILASLNEKEFSPRTYNKYSQYYSTLLHWYSEEYNVYVKKWFSKDFRKTVVPRPESITYKEYSALLETISPENGVKEYYKGDKHRRNHYRPWLKNGIRRGLETGRRREELVSMKWSDVKDEDGRLYIEVEDIKVNRIKNRATDKEKRYNYIPVTDTLKKLFDEMGYEEYKGSEGYILAPEEQIQRNRVMSDVLSRGFTHYYDQLGTGKQITFKSLRKTYITRLKIFMGNEKLRAVTGHSGDQVLEHYLDKKELAKSLRHFQVFPEMEEREAEITEIRNDQTNKQNQLSMEV